MTLTCLLPNVLCMLILADKGSRGCLVVRSRAKVSKEKWVPLLYFWNTPLLLCAIVLCVVNGMC